MWSPPIRLNQSYICGCGWKWQVRLPSAKLDNIDFDVFVLLVTYLNKIIPAEAYSEEELKELLVAHRRWIDKLILENELFNKRHRLTPHVIENIEKNLILISMKLDRIKHLEFKELKELFIQEWVKSPSPG